MHEMRDLSHEIEATSHFSKFDDDVRVKRTGTLVTATAHIITTVIGSGVLSLAWAIAQLGWVAGPVSLVFFSIITWFTSLLSADCYRSSDGKRNYNYKQAVESYLGGILNQLCGIAQYSTLFGATIGYSITTSISMVAIARSNCFHKKGHQAGCHMSNNPFIITNGIIQIVLSQIPNFHKLSGLSIIAAIMSVAYSSIGLSLSIAQIAEKGHAQTSLTGIPIGNNMSNMDKMWNTFSALGNIAFAYAFTIVLIEIQDTLKSRPPENEIMKQATTVGISTATIFYLACGSLGYAAFGHNAPGNLLTGFGFYDPFWLIDLANLCIAIHLIGAYQVLGQPLFAFVENWSREKWSQNKFITNEHAINLPFSCGKYNFSLFRLIWRSCYVIFTTIFAMLFPFFKDFLGLIGSATFWPLAVYFPIEMYIARAKIPRFSFTWIWMQILGGVCLIISLLAGTGSIRGLILSVRSFKPFQSIS